MTDILVEGVTHTHTQQINSSTLKTWYNDGFFIGLRQAAEISEHRHSVCFNCQKEGHHWHQCKEMLSPELQELSDQQDREREERKKKALNPRGGVGIKGGHAPTPLAGISPVAPQGALPTNTGMRTPSPGGWARRIWAGPSWMASAPRCWWTMAPESTR